MENRIEQYQETKFNRVFNQVSDKGLAQDIARADDDGFAVAQNNFNAQLTDRDSDCWISLWLLINSNGLRFLRRFLKLK